MSATKLSPSPSNKRRLKLSKASSILIAITSLWLSCSISHLALGISSNARPGSGGLIGGGLNPGSQLSPSTVSPAAMAPIPSIVAAPNPMGQISNGLFQSPAAQAAAAVVANTATNQQQSNSIANNQAAAAAAAAAVQQANGQQQQQAQPQPLPSVLAARVDTAELIKQANSAAGAQQPTTSSSLQQAFQASYANMEQDCANSGGFISFELITGYVLGAPAESMVMQPGTLQLTDCLNLCRQNSSCLAINFETGLCVLLQESADKNPQNLQKSQFPVFTIYAHKICIQGDRANRCHKSWSFERVIGWVLNNLEKKTILTKTRLECLLACYNEQTFQCKSFNYDSASGSCQLSDLDRHSLPSASLRRRHYVESTIDTIDYGENNCIQEARGVCDFKPLSNRILKTVDSIYQDIKTEPECRKRCLQASYRCHSYDLGDSSNPVCRTSHLDRNSLQQIQDPYLEIQGAISYELDNCYNVTVLCKSREMIARVKTNKVFNGKIYAKNAPLSCVNDITNSMDFELTMAFNDACSISRSAANNGIFTNEIVLQHNDMIVTNSDMGLNIKCQYDLRNQTVYNNINLDDFMSGREPIDIASQSAVVRSPNISMSILKSDGNFIQQAQVGDSLLLRFQITDERSPFEIFVRDLYAMDGVGGTEIMLVDGEGCPTDPSIMSAMTNSKGNGQTLEAQFDAFKFPTSETVAFRALVTPCIPHCEPVHCQNRVYDGTLYEAEAYGRRRRRKRSAMAAAATSAPSASSTSGSNTNGQGKQPAEVVVRNSIEIKDRFFQEEDGDGDGSGSNGDNDKLASRPAAQSGGSQNSLSPSTSAGANAASDQLINYSEGPLAGLSSDGINIGASAASAASAGARARAGAGKQRMAAAGVGGGNWFARFGGITVMFCALLLAQSVLFVAWALVWRRRFSEEQQQRKQFHNNNNHHHHHHPNNSNNNNNNINNPTQPQSSPTFYGNAVLGRQYGVSSS